MGISGLYTYGYLVLASLGFRWVYVWLTCRSRGQIWDILDLDQEIQTCTSTVFGTLLRDPSTLYKGDLRPCWGNPLGTTLRVQP